VHGGYQYSYVAPPKWRLARLAERTPRWVSPLGLTALPTGGVAYTLLMRPTATSATAMPTCVMKLFTGFDCPGCGGTRAAWYLLHCDIPAAAHHHAMMVFATPFLVYMYVSWTLNRLANRTVLPDGTLFVDPPGEDEPLPGEDEEVPRIEADGREIRYSSPSGRVPAFIYRRRDP
jgi:hypothetical protein